MYILHKIILPFLSLKLFLKTIVKIGLVTLFGLTMFVFFCWKSWKTMTTMVYFCMLRKYIEFSKLREEIASFIKGKKWLMMHMFSMTSAVSNCFWCYRLQSTRPLCLWDSPGKNTGVGWYVLIQGIFQTQGSNPYLLSLLHSRLITHWATWEALLII